MPTTSSRSKMADDSSQTNLILPPDQQSIALTEYPATPPETATKRTSMDLESLPSFTAVTGTELTTSGKVAASVATLLVAATLVFFGYTLHSIDEQYITNPDEPIPPD